HTCELWEANNAHKGALQEKVDQCAERIRELKKQHEKTLNTHLKEMRDSKKKSKHMLHVDQLQAEPDFVALRLEDVAVTFRDQPVLTSAMWGVRTGDRVGLVGANRAEKTTQLRILTGELRVVMLRQEFVDEIDPERSLRR
ncbi:hypothetical protein ACHAWF_005767, partial [Thalassiosira exigua]